MRPDRPLPSTGGGVPRDRPPAGFSKRDERRHDDAEAEEWWFACWGADGSFGVVSGYRIVGSGAWYWVALARAGMPLLHVTEWSVPRRSDPMLVKAPEMWAEHTCVAAFDQWTVGNEMYAAALDDPEEALGRAYGLPTPLAMDLEWYSTQPAEAWSDDEPGGVNLRGYHQRGVVHGLVELPDGPVELDDVPAERWHRWGGQLGPVPLPVAHAHLGLRAPFRFPDDSMSDLVLTSSGWCRRPSPGV